MKIVAVVPMKLNNKRLPQKNTKCFKNGEPLCCYILHTLLSVPQIEEIYVYCSNPEIKTYLPEGIQYLRREKVFDQDSTKMNEILLQFSKKIRADIYLMAHTTAPFITKENIQIGIQAVVSNQYDSAFTVKKIQDFIWKNGKPFNYDLTAIPRTQDLEPYYLETSGFYIYRQEVIQNMNRRIGEKPFFVEVGEIEGIDIDEAEDFFIANAVYNYQRSLKNGRGGENYVI